MPAPKNPFKRHRFPRDVILQAVRWYCRFALSYRDVKDLLEERGVHVDAATIYRWVRKFGPEIAKRSFKYKSCRSLTWHVDETYIRVGGKWRYLWRAVDQHGRLIDFRLTARRDAKAARAFFRQACDNARLYQPMTIVTDKAHSYSKVIGEMNRWSFPGEEIRHVDRKWKNNRIESDHAALKKLVTPTRGFKSLSAAKDTLKGIEAVRSIKRGHVVGRESGVAGEVRFVASLFKEAA
jgi:IS6 family transposase